MLSSFGISDVGNWMVPVLAGPGMANTRGGVGVGLSGFLCVIANQSSGHSGSGEDRNGLVKKIVWLEVVRSLDTVFETHVGVCHRN